VAVEQQLHLVQVLHNLALVEQVQLIGVLLQRQHHLQVLAVMVILLIQHAGAVTVTLPASPSAGDIISIADYASTWQYKCILYFVEIHLKLMEDVIMQL
jgi:hypothetical protein